MSEQLGKKAVDRRTLLKTGLGLVVGGVSYPLLSACSPGSSSASTAKSAAGAATGVASSAAGAGGAKTASVSVRFNWTVKGEFTPFFVAREKGYYEAENLKVDLLEGKSGTQAAQVVGTGNDDFGYIPSPQVIEGINKGIPLMTVATVGRYTGMCWASWPNVPLKGPDSLYGHKVSISTSSTFFQVWPGFQKKFNIDPSKVSIVHPDPSARVGLFLHKSLDIMADIFYANDYVILTSKTSDKLNLLKMSDLNFDPLGYLLVANKSIIQKNPDVVKRMVRATLKGLKDTLDNPDDAISIMDKLYGDRLTTKVIEGQVRNMADLMIKEPALGHGTDTVWNETLDLLSNSGVIKQKKAPSEYYTNDYLT